MKKNIFFLFLFSLFYVQAQVTFEAEVNHTDITIDETLVVNYILKSPSWSNLDMNSFNLTLPNFDNFSVVSTRKWDEEIMTNNEHLYSIIFSFILKPNKIGTIKIPPAAISEGGNTIRTKSFTIKVRSSSSRDSGVENSNNKMKDGFLAFEVTDSNPYQNQNIIGQLSFYAVNPFFLQNIRKFTPPKFDGFNAQIIEHDDQLISREFKHGRSYYKRVIYKVVLTPTRAGVNYIAPNEAEVLVSDGFYGQKALTIKSGKLKINVKPLPKNAPNDFTGAVGEFNMIVSPLSPKADAKETIKLEILINGKGNFTMVTMPEIKVPSEIEMYKPNVSKDIEISSRGEEGVMKKEVILVPQENGDFEVSLGAFSYFDPIQNQYISYSEKKFPLQISGVPEIKNDIVDTPDKEDEDTEDQSRFTTLFDSNSDHKSPYLVWGVIGTGLVLLSLGFLLFKKKKNSEKSTEVNAAPVINISQPKSTPSFPFIHIKNAHLQQDRAELYSEIEQMLKRAKPFVQDNASMQHDYEKLNSLLQRQKYDPFANSEKDDALYTMSKDFYQNYYS